MFHFTGHRRSEVSYFFNLVYIADKPLTRQPRVYQYSPLLESHLHPTTDTHTHTRSILVYCRLGTAYKAALVVLLAVGRKHCGYTRRWQAPCDDQDHVLKPTTASKNQYTLGARRWWRHAVHGLHILSNLDLYRTNMISRTQAGPAHQSNGEYVYSLSLHCSEWCSKGFLICLMSVKNSVLMMASTNLNTLIISLHRITCVCRGRGRGGWKPSITVSVDLVDIRQARNTRSDNGVWVPFSLPRPLLCRHHRDLWR